MVIMIDHFDEFFDIEESEEEKDSDLESSNDDEDYIWTIMTQETAIEEQPSFPFLLIVDFFKVYPEFYRW